MSTPRGRLSSLTDLFVALLPRIELHGRIVFRHLRCVQQRQEAIAEMVALVWKWCVRLQERGKDPAGFHGALVTFAARAVKSGRRLCGKEKPRDVLSPLAQRGQGFTVTSLPTGSSLHGTLYEEALLDNTQTPVDEQVCFRLDFPGWLLTRTDRDRRMVQDLMRGERTLDVARRYGTTPARVSQLRREFQQDWSRFCGDGDEGRLLL
jgi:hypothetical protein